MEAKPLFCSADGDPTGGIYFRCVLYILCISCFSEQGISVSTLSDVVSNRICLRGILLSLAALYAPPMESQGHFSSLEKMLKHFLVALSLTGFVTLGLAQNPYSSPALSLVPTAQSPTP